MGLLISAAVPVLLAAASWRTGKDSQEEHRDRNDGRDTNERRQLDEEPALRFQQRSGPYPDHGRRNQEPDHD